MKVMFLGNYEKGEVLPAPTIVSKAIFNKFSQLNHSAVYVCYFQDGSKYSRFQKLFGKELVDNNVYRCGIFRIFELVLKFKPDIIHLSTLEMFYIVLFPLKKLIKAKFIYTVHGLASYEFKHYITKTRFLKLRVIFNEWIVLHQADYVFALSERISRFISLHFKIRRKKILLFKNGIDSYPQIIKNYTEQINTVKIITVGSIDREEKGYSFLLGSLTSLQFPVELTIVSALNGGNKIFNNLPAHIKVIIKGTLNNKNLRQEMANNDIYIASARYETFSITLLESMNAGLLFIASDRVGLTDYFPDEFITYVVRYGNKAQLVNKIMELIELPISEKKTRSSEINKFSLGFEWGKVIVELEKKYSQILNE
jgi:glycosyltransferase involved in cell wall biosynthesis